jgi:predicted RNase H-like HicB family nuclease
MPPSPGVLKFETKDTIRVNPDGTFAVYIEPTGITVLGDTQEEALQKGKDAMMFFMQTINEKEGVAGLQRYLDRHEVPYVIEKEHVIEKEPLIISRPMELAVTTLG